MLARWLSLLVVGSAGSTEGPGEGGTLDCQSSGSEDWPSVQRRLFRLLEGEASGDVLGPELSRTVGPARDLAGDCAPGHMALRALLLLTTPGVDMHEAATFLAPDWHFLGVLGWPAVIRTGWPVFRLLRLLQRHCKAAGDEVGVPGCEDADEPFAALLARHVQRHRVRAGESLLASGAMYLLKRGKAGGRCPLSAAAAYLAFAWLRYPVYDEETEDLLRLAEPLVSSLELEQVLSTRHALVDMISDVAGTYQAFLIDSGALYKDLRPKEVLANTVDYTRHMMSGPAGDGAGGLCPVASARTPEGRCNVFAPLGPGLAPWRRRGVALEDTLRAFQEPASPPPLLLRIFGWKLHAALPIEEPERAEAGAACLAKIFLALAARARLPSIDLVVSLGGRPLRRLPSGPGAHRAPQGRREDVPAPLFSTCGREGFLGIPLPRLCGDRCVGSELTPGDAAGGASAEEAAGGQLVLVPMAKPNASGGDEDDVVLCYMFRLVISYAELLRYMPAPGQVPLYWISDLRSWRLPPPPPPDEADAFAARCAGLIDSAAQ